VQESNRELIFNGDGLLIYPGFAKEYGVDAPVPSLRLKWLREAVEDYTYIELLYQHGQANFARQQIQRIARNFADWQNDPELLMQVRDQLGSRLATIIMSGSNP
jgi:isocitrate dehydrogenase kinase/phosphatase